MTYGVGLGWTHGTKWFVGADVMMQKWGSVDFPGSVQSGANTVYALRSGLLKDSYKVNVGADYVPNSTSRNLLSRVHYRIGAGYATPYYYINGNKDAFSIQKRKMLKIIDIKHSKIKHL